MTEAQIERAVEAYMNNIDAEYLAADSPMTKAQYETTVKAVNAWAAAHYAKLAKEASHV